MERIKYHFDPWHKDRVMPLVSQLPSANIVKLDKHYYDKEDK